MTEPNQSELSLETQFELRTFNDNVDKMSREQAQDMLKTLYYKHIIDRQIYLKLLRKHMLGVE